MKKNLPKLLITGSEGLIGRKLVQYFRKRFNVLKLDLALGHDLTKEALVSDWFKNHKNLYGVIVCHARVSSSIPTKRSRPIRPTDVSLDEIRRDLEVNTISAFNVCRNFIKNNRGGVVINVSSIYGKVSPRHDIYKDYIKPIGYSLSKAAVIMMSKYLAAFYAPNFRINTVVLGGVSNRGAQERGFKIKYGKQSPMKRLMNVDELLSAFEFLLDERSSYVTGTEIYVDGGWTAW